MAAPVWVLADLKRKVVRAMFTLSLFVALADSQAKIDGVKLSAIKIAGKLFQACKLKKRDEYESLIINHLLKIMLEDEND